MCGWLEFNCWIGFVSHWAVLKFSEVVIQCFIDGEMLLFAVFGKKSTYFWPLFKKHEGLNRVPPEDDPALFPTIKFSSTPFMPPQCLVGWPVIWKYCRIIAVLFLTSWGVSHLDLGSTRFTEPDKRVLPSMCCFPELCVDPSFWGLFALSAPEVLSSAVNPFFNASSDLAPVFVLLWSEPQCCMSVHLFQPASVLSDIRQYLQGLSCHATSSGGDGLRHSLSSSSPGVIFTAWCYIQWSISVSSIVPSTPSSVNPLSSSCSVCHHWTWGGNLHFITFRASCQQLSCPPGAMSPCQQAKWWLAACVSGLDLVSPIELVF